MPEPDFLLDFDRRDRIGIEEAVYCAGKSGTQIAAILDAADARGRNLLLTRLEEAQISSLDPGRRRRLDYDAASRTAFFGVVPIPRSQSEVAILSAGTTDLPVAREAGRTLHYHGRSSTSFADIGVAGLWRVLDRIEALRNHRALIIVAGMDAALPSVVAGLVPGLVVAVPTSVGYGVAAGGHAALHAVLASCAPGVAVVNIDNGYGAACVVLRLLNGLGTCKTATNLQPETQGIEAQTAPATAGSAHRCDG
jgi:NCAIR mutase (PurE)-related protein